MWPALIAAGASLVGGMMNNSASKANADSTNDFNAQQAQANRDFQERMSNTAYQRGVADMEKAGLNPMLAYSQGPAQVPTGSSASGVVAQVENPVPKAVQAFQSVSSAQQAQAQVEQTKATVNNINADTANKLADNPYISIRGDASRAQGELYAQQAHGAELDVRSKQALLPYLVQKISSDITSNLASAYSARATGSLMAKKAQGFSSNAALADQWMGLAKHVVPFTH